MTFKLFVLTMILVLIADSIWDSWWVEAIMVIVIFIYAGVGINEKT